MIFQQKNLEKVYFIFKLTCRAMVRPASSDKWKAPLVSYKLCHHYLDWNANKKDFLKSISNLRISLSFLLVWN